jgi:AcrR family transcriptional regulator
MTTKPPKKDEILACAIELFQQQGFEAVTLNMICEKVAITKTTFYYYYQSKEDILLDYFSLENIYSSDELLSILASGSYLDQWTVRQPEFSRADTAPCQWP